MAIERLFATMQQDSLAKAQTLSRDSTQLLQQGNLREAQQKQREIDLVLNHVCVLGSMAADVKEKLKIGGIPDLESNWLDRFKSYPHTLLIDYGIEQIPKAIEMEGTTEPGKHELEQKSDVKRNGQQVFQQSSLDNDPEDWVNKRKGVRRMLPLEEVEIVDIEDSTFKRKLAERDPKAWDDFVQAINKQALSYTTRILLDSETGKEALQDAYERAWRNIDTFRVDKRLGTWFFSIISHRCIDILRRRRTRRQIPLAYFQNEEGDYPDNMFVENNYPEILIEQQETNEDLHVRIDKLPIAFKAPLILRSQGFSYKEIAGILNLRETTVRMRLYRGRQIAYGLLVSQVPEKLDKIS